MCDEDHHRSHDDADLLDDAVAVVERRRTAAQPDPGYQTQRMEALQRACARLARDLPALPAALTLGHIAAGCALGYLEFRLPELDC